MFCKDAGRQVALVFKSDANTHFKVVAEMKERRRVSFRVSRPNCLIKSFCCILTLHRVRVVRA